MKTTSYATDASADENAVLRTSQFVVGLGDRVSPTDIEEGMRVG